MAEPETWTRTTDVTLRWIERDPTISDSTILVKIIDAEDLLRQAVDAVGDEPLRDLLVEDDIEAPAGQVPMARLRRIVATIVIRHLDNPRGVRQRQSAEGPFSGSETLAGDEPGALRVTARDVTELLGRARASSAFSINTAPAWFGLYEPDLTARPADACSLPAAWVNGPCSFAPTQEC